MSASSTWQAGDRVEISIPMPGTGLMPDDDYLVPGIAVDLEERFDVDGRTYWRAKFVNRLGHVVVLEP